MKLRRNNQNGTAVSEADVLLQLQFGEELARRYEQEHIALELRAADVQAREARIAELEGRVRELEAALAQAVAEERRRAASVPEVETPPAEEAAASETAPTTITRRRPSGRRLGKELVKQRIVTKRAVREALQIQKRTGAPLGEILVGRGAITPARLLEVLAELHGVSVVRDDDRGIGLLPAPVALEQRAVALAVGSEPVALGALTAVAFVDLEAAPGISTALKGPIEPRLTDAETMVRLFADAYAGGAGPTAAEANPDSEAHDRPQEPAKANGALPRTSADTASADSGDPSREAGLRQSSVVDEPEPEDRRREPEPEPELPAADAPLVAATNGVSTVSGAPTPVRMPARQAPRRGWLRRGRPTASTPGHIGARPMSRPANRPEGDAAAEGIREPSPQLPGSGTGATPSVMPAATIVVAMRSASSTTVALLADALSRLDYPRDRLQAMVVFASADPVTSATLRAVPLPDWVATVPLTLGRPVSDRDLLLCGLHEATGDVITVVRAEGQLRGDVFRTSVLRATAGHPTAGNGRGASAMPDPAGVYLRQLDPVGPGGPGLVVFHTAQLRSALGSHATSAI